MLDVKKSFCHLLNREECRELGKGNVDDITYLWDVDWIVKQVWLLKESFSNVSLKNWKDTVTYQWLFLKYTLLNKNYYYYAKKYMTKNNYCTASRGRSPKWRFFSVSKVRSRLLSLFFIISGLQNLSYDHSWVLNI